MKIFLGIMKCFLLLLRHYSFNSVPKKELTFISLQREPQEEPGSESAVEGQRKLSGFFVCGRVVVHSLARLGKHLTGKKESVAFSEIVEKKTSWQRWNFRPATN